MASPKSTLPLAESPRPAYDHSDPNIQDLIRHLASHDIEHDTGVEERTSKSSTKHSPATKDQIPKAVFFPHTTQDTALIVKACHERNVAVTSFGGGTSLGGVLTATRGGICVDFKYMDKVLVLHEDDMDITVQPNVGWVELNRLLEPKGLFFPPDPAPGAKIGGMVSLLLM
jgi:D-lactate dehydrogenase (cytochrome)